MEQLDTIGDVQKWDDALSSGNKLPITWVVQAEGRWPPLGDDGADISSLDGEVELIYSKYSSNYRTLVLMLGFSVIFGLFSPLGYEK